MCITVDFTYTQSIHMWIDCVSFALYIGYPHIHRPYYYITILLIKIIYINISYGGLNIMKFIIQRDHLVQSVQDVMKAVTVKNNNSNFNGN